MRVLLRTGLILGFVVLSGCGGGSGGGGGDDRKTTSPGDNPPEEVTPVADCTINGVIAGGMEQALVEAARYDGSGWNAVGEPVRSDGQGRFTLALPEMEQPLRVRISSTPESLRRCDAPSGCNGVAQGERFSPDSGYTLSTLVPTDGGCPVASGTLVVSPMTTMAAHWAGQLPPGLSNASTELSLSRMGQLLGLAGSPATTAPADLSHGQSVADASTGARRHAYLSAAFDELAQSSQWTVSELSEGAAVMFSALGGQLPIAAVDLEGGPVAESLRALGLDPESVWPDLEQTNVTVPGLESLLAAAATVAESIRPGSDDAAEVAVLLDPWESRSVTAMVGSARHSQQDLDQAMSLVEEILVYRDQAIAGADSVHPDHRGLGWLYADEQARTDTADMLGVLGEALGFAVDAALCVPERKNGGSCDVDPPYATLVEDSGKTFWRSGSLMIQGERSGQQVDLVFSAEDIRDLVTGEGQMPITMEGQIVNDTAELTLDLRLDMDLGDNDLSGFNELSTVEFANAEIRDPLIEELLAHLRAAITFTGDFSLVARDESMGEYRISNIDTRLWLDRSVLTQGTDGPLLDIRVVSGERVNPAGETLSTLDGQDGLRLTLEDAIRFSTAFVSDRLGLPPVTVVANSELEGGEELVAVMEDLLDTLLSGEGDLADLDLEPLMAVLTPDLLDFQGEATVSVADTEKGQRDFGLSQAPQGGLAITGANSQSTAMVLHLPGLYGAISRGEGVLATVHPGLMEDDWMLARVDGTSETIAPFERSLEDNRVGNLIELLIPLFEALVPEEEQ
ncbi:MAG: hypothetical protein R3296_04050 [Oleiphilaceae bacterium]|nr:hypothetical protein [Oleiphilaceae bacterium]